MSGTQKLLVYSIPWPYAERFGSKDLTAFYPGLLIIFRRECAHSSVLTALCSVAHRYREENLCPAEAAGGFRRQWVISRWNRPRCAVNAQASAEGLFNDCLESSLLRTQKFAYCCDLHRAASSASSADAHKLFGSGTWYLFLYSSKGFWTGSHSQFPHPLLYLRKGSGCEDRKKPGKNIASKGASSLPCPETTPQDALHKASYCCLLLGSPAKVVSV